MIDPTQRQYIEIHEVHTAGLLTIRALDALQVKTEGPALGVALRY